MERIPDFTARGSSARVRTSVQRDQLSQDLASLKIDRNAPRGGGSSARGLVIGVLVVAAVIGIAYAVVVPRVKSKLMTAEIRTGEVTLVSPAQSEVQLTA